MSSFQLKSDFITTSNTPNTASLAEISARDALKVYIENYTDQDILTLIQLGMEASLKRSVDLTMPPDMSCSDPYWYAKASR